jgi:Uma2 family endonuclease
VLHPMSGRWTAEMLPALPDDGNKYEVIDGELYVTPRPSIAHQLVVVALGSTLFEYLRALESAVVLPDIEVRDGDRTAVRPDLVVTPLHGGRVPPHPLDGHALLLAVEILSPATRAVDLGAKRELYARLEIPEYWTVDIEQRVVERWHRGAASAEVNEGLLVWRLSGNTPELLIELEEIFERA